MVGKDGDDNNSAVCRQVWHSKIGVGGHFIANGKAAKVAAGDIAGMTVFAIIDSPTSMSMEGVLRLTSPYLEGRGAEETNRKAAGIKMKIACLTEFRL
jgi:hypothetical protein